MGSNESTCESPYQPKAGLIGIYTHTYTCTYTYVSMYIYIHVYIYMCIYILYTLPKSRRGHLRLIGHSLGRLGICGGVLGVCFAALAGLGGS